MIDGGSIMNHAVKLIASSNPLPRTRYRPAYPPLLPSLTVRRITNGPMMNTRFPGSPMGPTHIVGTHLPSGADAVFSSLIKYSLYPRCAVRCRSFYPNALIPEVLFSNFNMHAYSYFDVSLVKISPGKQYGIY